MSLKTWNRKIFGVLDLNIDSLVGEMNELDNVAAEGGAIDSDKCKLLSKEF